MKELRRVEINGHQEYWKGWFHKFVDSVDYTGKPEPVAIIENDGGHVSLVAVRKITFIDKETKAGEWLEKAGEWLE